MSMDAALPNDLEACQRELVHTRSVLAETAVACEEQLAQIEKLRTELELVQRYLYGRRSERHQHQRQCQSGGEQVDRARPRQALGSRHHGTGSEHQDRDEKR